MRPMEIEAMPNMWSYLNPKPPKKKRKHFPCVVCRRWVPVAEEFLHAAAPSNLPPKGSSRSRREGRFGFREEDEGVFMVRKPALFAALQIKAGGYNYLMRHTPPLAPLPAYWQWITCTKGQIEGTAWAVGALRRWLLQMPPEVQHKGIRAASSRLTYHEMQSVNQLITKCISKLKEKEHAENHRRPA